MFRDNLLGFTRFTYPEYEVSAHHIEIAEALERVENGKCRRLIIVCPPQKGKTELLIRFMSWLMSRNPDKRIVYASYGAERSEMVSGECRDIAASEEFRALHPHLKLAPETKSKAHWKFEAGRGYVHAVGVGGPTTGFTSDCTIIDDAFKDDEEAQSEGQRDKVWRWFKAVILTRKRMANVPTVVVGTRWHEDDLIGRLLHEQPDKWELLHLKAIDDDGNPLWPERWSLEDYMEIKHDDTTSSHVWSALYQGEPVPAEGLLFQRPWLRVADREPRLTRWVRAWDLSAMMESHGDYTVGARVGVDDVGCLWIADVIRFRAEWPEARNRILEAVRDDPDGTLVGIEKVAWQLAMIQDLRNNPMFLRVPLVELRPDKKKELRAAAWAARAEHGKVALCLGPWNSEFIDECLRFPYGTHDDQVDAVSYAANMLLQMSGQYIQQEVPPPNTSWNYFKILGGIEDPEDDDSNDWYDWNA